MFIKCYVLPLTVLANLIATVFTYVKVVRDYHEEVGIPTAERIRHAEDKLFIGRIEHGALASEHAHPYLAGLIIDLINNDKFSVCGSSLVSSNRLVTAAHCWWDGHDQAWQFTVVLGSNLLYRGGTRIKTRQVITYPGWEPKAIRNDVAVIYLPVNVEFSNSIYPIELSTWTGDLVGQWATATGFGTTSDTQIFASSRLNQVDLQIITEEQCAAVYGTQYVQPTTICTNGAGGVGLCHGDSGGPLVMHVGQKPVLIGISSFVALEGCGIGLPSAFSRVSSYYNFITQHLL